MKIYSWNVNGIRAVLDKNALQNLIRDYSPDILCLQEIKAKQGQAEKCFDLADYEEFWNPAERAGYSGTAIFTKIKPQAIFSGFSEKIQEKYRWSDVYGDLGKEGRILTAEFDDFFLITVYVPNVKHDLSRLLLRQNNWDKALLDFVKELESKKPVIICGDFNVAHQAIDLANPKQNEGNAGYTKEERHGFDNFIEHGLADSFRHFHPNEVRYSWWSYRSLARERNIGWRIDYFLISKKLASKIKRAEILNNVGGSDHCPVMIEIK